MEIVMYIIGGTQIETTVCCHYIHVNHKRALSYRTYEKKRHRTGHRYHDYGTSATETRRRQRIQDVGHGYVVGHGYLMATVTITHSFIYNMSRIHGDVGPYCRWRNGPRMHVCEKLCEGGKR